MAFEVTFDDQPYPLPPELVPPALGLLPSDQSPDKLALFEAVGRLQRDLSRLSGRLQLNIKSQQEALMKVEEAMGGLESRFREQSLVRPPAPTVVTGSGASLEQLTPPLQKLSEQLIAIQRKVNPLTEQLDAVKASYKDKVEEGIIERILPVLDSFERLFEQAAQIDDPKTQKWLEGVGMIHNQLRSFLRTQGVEEVPALGLAFDPKIFAAVGTDPTDAYAPNTISRVGRTGYQRKTESGEKLLRVPEVFVAKPSTETVRLDESQKTRAEILEEEKRQAQLPPEQPATPVPAPAPVAVETPPVESQVVDSPAPPPDTRTAGAPADSEPNEPLPTLDAASIEIGPGEDKFAAIRARAEAALKGDFEPEAHLDTAHPTPISTPPPSDPEPTAPPTAFAGWGDIGAEALVPDTPPALPAQDVNTVDAPPLEGGAEEYYANGDALYELRMSLELTLAEFWGHAFGKQLGDTQLMDLGEAIEREEESIDEKELGKLAKGLGLERESLGKRFRKT